MEAGLLRKIWNGFLFIVGAVTIVIGMMLWTLRPETGPAAPNPEFFALSARVDCRFAVEKQLHDPGSAEWIDQQSWSVVVQGQGTILDPGAMVIVTASLRANNAFGAKVMGQYRCLLRRTSDDRWLLLGVEQG